MQKQITVFEIRLKVFLIKDIPLSKMLTAEAYFIDSVLTKDQEWLTYHETNQYKLYCMNGLFPLERDGIYKKEQIYTITIRTVEAELARYFAKELSNHSSNQMKGLIAERRIVPKKMISEIYTLTPVIQKWEQGYWKVQASVEEYERRIFENAIKKYKQFIGNEEIDEKFQLYTGITFLNRKPVPVEYKGIRLLGDKLNLKITDNKQAQELAYFLTGVGIGEINSRGMGFCNYRWL